MNDKPVLLLVEDEPTLREALCDTLELAGYAVTTAANGVEAAAVLADPAARDSFAMVISDVQMAPMDGHALLAHIRAHCPEMPVLLMTAYGTIQKAVEAMQAGAIDYLVKPFDAAALLDTVARHVRAEDVPQDDMVSVDQRSRYLASLAQRVAGTDATVMITGESGVGKEVLARYIHRNSARAQGPFVAINCAAIPENMLEATLFGYEKGAFTGAYAAMPGKFEQAQHGTLLLDEISEMDLGLQAKLLRVLQEREVERLGGRRPVELDVRVLATSNRVLREEVAAGRFREDLFYRLNVFPLHLPALRERVEDIVPIARRLLARSARAQSRMLPRLAPEAETRLLAHGWPGNVRELDNVLQRALILQPGAVVGAQDLQFESCDGALQPPSIALAPAIRQIVPDPESNPESKRAAGLDEELRGREQQLLVDTLRAVSGSRKAAAERLGISERTLRYKLARIRKAGIEVPA